MPRMWVVLCAVLFAQGAAARDLARVPHTYNQIAYRGTNCAAPPFASDPTPCLPNTPVTLWIMVPVTAADTAVWNFGDGSPALTASANATVTHSFRPGQFGIAAQVTTAPGIVVTPTVSIFSGYGWYDFPLTLSVVEGGSVALTVSRSSMAAGSTLQFSTLDQTATAGRRYVATSGTLAFAAGETSKTIVVPTINDTIFDNPQTFFITLQTPSADGYFLKYDSMVVTITDDDPPPQFSFAAARFDANEPAGQAAITIRRTGDMLRIATVSLRQSGFSPCRPGNPSDQQVTFAPGESTKLIDITFANDAYYEGTCANYLEVEPGDRVSKVVDPTHATLWVADDDPPPAISYDGLNLIEGDSTNAAQIGILLSGDVYAGSITIDPLYGTASPSDVRADRQTLSVGLGVRRVAYGVTVFGNRVVQGNRTMRLQVTPSFPSSPPPATLTVVDDDVEVVPSSLLIPFGTSGTLHVRWGQPQGARTLNISAPAGAGVPASVTAAAGSTSVAIPASPSAPGNFVISIVFPPDMFPRTVTAVISAPNLPVPLAVPQQLTMALGATAAFSLSLSPPQPAIVPIGIRAEDPSVVAVPASVSVAPSASVSVPVQALKSGATTLTLTGNGIATAQVAVEVALLGKVVVEDVVPPMGPPAGGTPVTIHGDSFAAPCSMTFGDVAGSNVVVVDAKTITATTPPHEAAAVTVRVVCSTIGELADGFRYVAPRHRAAR